VINFPGFEREPNLFQIAIAANRLGSNASLIEHGRKNAGKDGENGQDDQELDERERLQALNGKAFANDAVGSVCFATCAR
jgi:hypothetical protein